MARLYMRWVSSLLIILFVVLIGYTYIPKKRLDTEDDKFGIVPKEGLGRAGDAYPTKPAAEQYPTLKPGALRNQPLGFILKDDNAPAVRRGRWFQEESLDQQPGNHEKETQEKRQQDEKVKDVKEEESPPKVKVTPLLERIIPKGAPLATVMPRIPGVNVISMTLYGSDLRYTMGAVRNAELAKVNFPGWTLRIYTETPSESPHYGLVPTTVIERLRALGADIHYMDPNEDWVPPMMWRFLVADDVDWVDRFIVRDTDSRLIERDAAAVYDWVKSGRMFHSIRDHPSHAGFAISGGLWGAKPKEMRNYVRAAWKDILRGKKLEYLKDMEFLNKLIWPRVEAFAFCSDSVSCDHWPNSYPFPLPRYGYEHVGEVYNEHDLGRPMDIDIIRHAGENPNCLPGKKVFHSNNTLSDGLHKIQSKMT